MLVKYPFQVVYFGNNTIKLFGGKYSVMETETIQDIKQLLGEVKAVLKPSIWRKHENERFGNEDEYTGSSIGAELQILLNDLGGFMRAHKQFLRLSTYDERNEIINLLNRIKDYLSMGDYSAIIPFLNQLKVVVRRYRTGPSSESEEVLINRANDLLAICADLEEKKEEVEKIREEAGKAKENYDFFVQRWDEFRENYEQIENLRSQARDCTGEVEQLLVEAKSKEEVINSFVSRIDQREVQLGEQEEKNQQYEEQLNEYKKEQDEILEEGRELIKGAKESLIYTTAAGISGAINERYAEEKAKGRKNIIWLVLATLFAGGSMSFGYFMLGGEGALTLGTAVARIAVMSVGLSAAWFCAAQYVRYRNTMEDYGYKSVLASSIVAFLEQFKDPDERGHYLYTVLREIHQDPLRRKHDVDTPASSLWDRFMKAKSKRKETAGELVDEE